MKTRRQRLAAVLLATGVALVGIAGIGSNTAVGAELLPKIPVELPQPGTNCGGTGGGQWVKFNLSSTSGFHYSQSPPWTLAYTKNPDNGITISDVRKGNVIHWLDEVILGSGSNGLLFLPGSQGTFGGGGFSLSVEGNALYDSLYACVVNISTLTITKVLEGGVGPATVAFAVDCVPYVTSLDTAASYGDGPVEVNVAPGQTQGTVVVNVPASRQASDVQSACRVSETVPGGYTLVSPPAQPVIQNVGPDGAAVTFVNARNGQIEITKLITDKWLPNPQPIFQFSLNCEPPTLNFPSPENAAFAPSTIQITKEIQGAGSVLSGDIPAGYACTVEELGSPTYAATSPQVVIVRAGATTKISFTNVRKTAFLNTSKTVVGPTVAFDPTEFAIAVECKLGNVTVYSETLTLAHADLNTTSNLPTEAVCTATEQAPAGFSASVKQPAGSVITDGATVPLDVVNTRLWVDLVINKTVVSGIPGDFPVTFKFKVTCRASGASTGPTWSPVSLVSVTADQNGQFSSVPLSVPQGASCTVEEQPVEGWVTPPSATVATSSNVEVQFVNARQTTSYVIEKRVVGPRLASDPRSFTFETTCSVNDVPTRLADTVIQTTTTGTANINLPNNSACVIAENTDGLIGQLYETSNPDVIDFGRFVFVNTRRTGDLLIQKIARGQAGTFVFDVNCDGFTLSSAQSVVTIQATDPAESFPGGTFYGSATLTGIPVGAACSVTERPDADFDLVATGSSAEHPSVSGASAAAPVDTTTDNIATIDAEDLAYVTFDNQAKPGEIIISKAVSNASVLDQSATFTVNVTCTDPDKGKTTSVNLPLTVATPAVAKGIPASWSCTVTEPVVGANYTFVSVVPALTEVVKARSSNRVVVTNRRDTGEIVVRKDVRYPSFATQPVGEQFAFSVVCNTADPLSFTLTDDGSRSVVVPVGSKCTITESAVAGFITSVNGAASATAEVNPVVAGKTDVLYVNRRVFSPGIAVKKTSDATLVGGVPTVRKGTTVNYRFEVTLTPGSIVPLSAVTVADDKCAPVTGPTRTGGNSDAVLEAGETWVYTCASALNATTTNKVTASGLPAPDDTLTNPPALPRVSATADHTVVVIDPKISLTKTSNLAGQLAGLPVTFQVTVTNSGDSTLTSVVVTDPLLPECGFTVATLAVRASQSKSCTTTVTGSFTNTANVTATPLVGPAVTATASAVVESVPQLAPPVATAAPAVAPAAATTTPPPATTPTTVAFVANTINPALLPTQPPAAVAGITVVNEEVIAYTGFNTTLAGIGALMLSAGVVMLLTERRSRRSN